MLKTIIFVDGGRVLHNFIRGSILTNKTEYKIRRKRCEECWELFEPKKEWWEKVEDRVGKNHIYCSHGCFEMMLP